MAGENVVPFPEPQREEVELKYDNWRTSQRPPFEGAQGDYDDYHPWDGFEIDEYFGWLLSVDSQSVRDHLGVVANDCLASFTEDAHAAIASQDVPKLAVIRDRATAVYKVFEGRHYLAEGFESVIGICDAHMASNIEVFNLPPAVGEE